MELVPVRCRIPDILRSIDKSQQWLSEKTGYTKQRISDYTKMRYIMSLPVAAVVAHALRVTIDELYDWKWQRVE